MSIVEYARTFAISDMTVRRRIRTGKLEAELREGKYFIPVHMDANGSPLKNTAPPIQKSHPAPAQNYAAPKTIQPAAIPTKEINVQRRNIEAPLISPSIKSKILAHQSTSSDAGTLLQFCNNALQELQNSNHNLKNYYEQKLATLDSQLNSRDLEITHLRQQVEDLQTLTQVLESKLR